MNITELLAKIIDDIDKIQIYLTAYEENTREVDIARQKLEEAVFWLTYREEEKSQQHSII